MYKINLELGKEEGQWESFKKEIKIQKYQCCNANVPIIEPQKMVAGPD